MQNRMLYPVRSAATAIYVKEVVASGIAKKQKSPCMSRKNPGLTHGHYSFYSRKGQEVYAEKVSLPYVPIDMIHSNIFIIS